MFENIPKQLKEMNQWVCYQATPKGERITKVPVNPSNGKAIDVNNTGNWLTFNEAVHEIKQGNNRISGIGFVFSDHDPFIGIDLDDCINENGGLSSLASEVVQSFAGKAYIEYSPSGREFTLLPLGKSRMVLLKILITVLRCTTKNVISRLQPINCIQQRGFKIVQKKFGDFFKNI